MSRFLSIFGIVAIGVGFFSGVKAAAPDMKATADKYFDDRNLMNFRIVSTYGFDEKDAEALKSIEGAEVYPTYYTDVLVACEGRPPATARVMSLGSHLDKVDMINLIEGRMPENEHECLINSTKMKGGPKVGSKVTFTNGDGEIPDDMMTVNEYTIVGSFGTAMFIDKTARGSTSIGNGSIESVYLIPEENFCVEYNTEVYIRIPSLDPLNTYSEEYEKEIDRYTDIIEEISDSRADGRYADILDEANEKIADGEKELEDARKKLSDAQNDIDDAEQQIADGEQQLEDGKRELAEKEAEYDDKIAEAEQKIADAEKEIAENEEKIADGEKEIADNEQKLADAEKEIADGEKEIAENEQKLIDAKKELDDGEKEYADGLAEYNDGVKKFEDGEKAYNDGLEKYNSGAADIEAAEKEYNDGYAQYEAGMAQLDATKKMLDETAAKLEMMKGMVGETNPQYIAAYAEYSAGLAQYEAGKAQLDATEAQLAAAKMQIDGGKAQLAESKKQLDEAAAEIEKNRPVLEESRTKLDDARKKLDDGWTEYNDGKQKLDDGKAKLADAKKEVEDGRKELEDGKAELLDGKQKIEDGKKDLEDGKRELEEKKAEADEKFADARQEIADAEKDLEDGRKKLEDGKKDYEQGLVDFADGEQELADAKEKLADLSKPKWYIFTREDNPGFTEYGENANRIDNIASVFPVFFVLVAILVCLTTMSRMVEEQRVQIGTFKALGYGNGTIIFKYMFYALTATFTGAVVGILIGMNLLPYVIINAYGLMYELPELVMNIDIPVAGAAIGFFIIAISLTVYFTCRSALGEQSAQLMRPKAPKIGKRILLERITPLWKLFNFSGKVTARNLFRYKRKMLMTVVGVSGCTALLLTGFALYDSINDIIAKQYDELQHYDGLVAYDTEQNENAAEETELILSEYGESVRVYQKKMTVDAGGAKKVEAYIVVPSDTGKLSEFMTIRKRTTGEPISLSGSNILIDEKMSIMLGNVGSGSRLTLSSSDTEKYSFTLTDYFENYPNHYVYMTETSYEEVFGKLPEYNTLYFTHNRGVDGEDALAEEMLKVDGVVAVNFNSSQKSSFSDMLVPLDFVIVVIIGAAGLLAFIVLYNLTNINITERIREIATLKVLGFYDGEVDSYIFRENILLSILGTAAGLILGIFLANFVITTAEVDLVMFGRNIYLPSYIYAAVVTLLFSMLVTVVMHGKLKNINMIEALKSIE